MKSYGILIVVEFRITGTIFANSLLAFFTRFAEVVRLERFQTNPASASTTGRLRRIPENKFGPIMVNLKHNWPHCNIVADLQTGRSQHNRRHTTFRNNDNHNFAKCTRTHNMRWNCVMRSLMRNFVKFSVASYEISSFIRRTVSCIYARMKLQAGSKCRFSLLRRCIINYAPTLF